MPFGKIEGTLEGDLSDLDNNAARNQVNSTRNTANLSMGLLSMGLPQHMERMEELRLVKAIGVRKMEKVRNRIAMLKDDTFRTDLMPLKHADSGICR